MITDALVVVAFAYGIGSAMIPVLNAEAYVAATAALLSAPDTVWMVIAVTAGTVVGKVILFRAARAGRDIARNRPKKAEREPGRIGRALRRANAVLMGWLDHPVRAVLTVMVSGFAGIPPLLAVAVVAGASQMRMSAFAVAMGIGRLGRFGLIAATAYGVT